MRRGVPATNDEKAFIAVAYVKAGRNAEEAARQLNAWGMDVTAGFIREMVKTDADVMVWVDRFIQEAYGEKVMEALQSATAAGIQHLLEEGLARMQRLHKRLEDDSTAEFVNPVRIRLLKEIATQIRDDLIKLAYIPMRFRDGLHPKVVGAGPVIDQSTHQVQEYNIQRAEVLPPEEYKKEYDEYVAKLRAGRRKTVALPAAVVDENPASPPSVG